ncbi:MAG: hypothetical protein ACI9MR_000927 [Myxococcota bacterium]|jgi:hypothetical protein
MLNALAISLSLTVLAAPTGLANQPHGGQSVSQLAEAALGDNPAPAIAALRAHGPSAVDALRVLHADADSADRDRYAQLIDSVARQLHAVESGLYWYTDLEAAKAAATVSNKPILSLRLLGQLDSELSCANSRFFRTVLYANQSIATFLHDNYVLHWEAVRDQVPQITVDFGRGRKIVRTITGNSLHYVMTANGTPVDALPGLYGPAAFKTWLEGSEILARTVSAAPSLDAKQAALTAHHRAARTATLTRWQTELAESDVAAEPTFADLEAATTIAGWKTLSNNRRPSAALDTTSRTLVVAGFPPAEVAMPIAVAKSRAESPMLRQMRNFETTIALDETLNDYRIHTQIHAWFEARPVQAHASWTERIYAELFKTPLNDPWMGLAPPDAYAAIVGGGLIAPREAQADVPAL